MISTVPSLMLLLALAGAAQAQPGSNGRAPAAPTAIPLDGGASLLPGGSTG